MDVEDGEWLEDGEQDEEQELESQAVVPFRHRHDGWTHERQQLFLVRLGETGCVREACRAAGLSNTSAYRAYHRIADFAMRWNEARRARRPLLEDVAFARAVKGERVPLVRLGKVVGYRRRYSDSLLRFLIDREDRRAAKAPPDKRLMATRDETTDAILKKLAIVEKRYAAKARDQQLAWCERMEREGKAP